MSIITAKKFKQLNNDLIKKSEKFPLYSKEVVEVSQQLDLIVLQAMKKQFKNKQIPINQ